MALQIITFILGPLENNVYLAADPQSGAAVVIDPSFDIEPVTDALQQRGWHLEQIWITHAHFDHFAGAADLARSAQPPIPIALHPADLPLWYSHGGGGQFGFQVKIDPAPSVELGHGTRLRVGAVDFEVRHTPGHTLGHVSFYAPTENVLFCGDVIFRGGIGRTDLTGGSHAVLMETIRTQVLTLPDATRLLSGHGPETTVDLERQYNPFL